MRQRRKLALPSSAMSQSGSSTKTRWIRRAALALGSLLVADQAAQWAVLGREGWLLGRRVAPYDPPLFIRSQFATIERLAADPDSNMRAGDVVFDAELGWNTVKNTDQHGPLGERLGTAPAFDALQRRDGAARIAVFGCSFTFGSEVPGHESWPSQLDASRSDLELLNFGVPGYGADQALLRYRSVREKIDVDEVWFGLLPATLVRLISCYRPTLRRYTPTVATKPRFELDGAGTRLIPHAARSAADLVRIVRDPARFAEVAAADGYARRWPSAYSAALSHPAHWFATTRLLLTYLERGGRDWEQHLRASDGPCFKLAERILGMFAEEVRATGAQFRVLILPDYDSLLPAVASDQPWTRLVTALEDAGIEVFDTAPALRRANVTEIADYWATNGHYAKGCNGVVAAALATLR